MSTLRLRIATSILVCGFTRGAVAQVEPTTGQWKTWVIPAASQLRLPAPPDKDATTRELAWLHTFAAGVNDTARNQVAYWNAGSPGYRWMQLTLSQLQRRNIGGPAGTRAMALVAAAVYDATVAAWDSKYAYHRPRPAEMDATIHPLVDDPASPSYPSEHAVAAGAASTVLSYLFPDAADDFQSLAEEAARSRLYAGTQFPSDTAAGLSLGRTVGGMVVSYAQSDGSDQRFTGSFPPSPGVWGSPNPTAPLAGTWKPWVLTSGSQYRLAAPPEVGTPGENDQVALVKGLDRTTGIQQIAWFWQPSFQNPWYDMLNQRLFESTLSRNAPRAARAYALAAIAQHDATIACWDTKYVYLRPRPSQVDATFTPLFPNPTHPSHPSGHACASGGFASVMSYLFPAESDFFAAKAVEAGDSTFFAGIHFLVDVEAGLKLGNTVGQAVVSRAQADGSK